MSDLNLTEWAASVGRFDDRHWCGDGITVADVKRAVDQQWLAFRAALTDAKRRADDNDAEIARLTAELAAARAVTAGVCRYLDCAASDLLAVVTSLYETRARAISDATAARGTVGGQTGPVGKLLGSHAIVEWYAAPDWYQARIAQHRTGTVKGADLRWRHENARNWSSWGQPWGDPAQHMDQPARLVPAAEADADPNQRGPLPKGG